VSSRVQFLQYVENTNGGATKANFVEDWEPIGERAWDELWGAELIEFDDNLHVRLTKHGREELKGSA
jgi:hypothetical protein